MTRPSLYLDVFVVLGITLVVAFLAMQFQWNEVLFSRTRRWEWAQLDELPVVLFALAMSLAWMSWRRSVQLEAQLKARSLAEARLAGALTDNQRLAHQNLRIQESERKRLARELHDELGQYCNAIKLDAVAIARDASRQDTPATLAAQRIVTAADHVHAVISDVIRRLRPAGLDELGLAAAIESCVDRWRHSQPDVQVNLIINGSFEDLGELTTLTLYRLIQEGLTNCSRHAQATTLKITVDLVPDKQHDTVQVSLIDNGCGADTSQLSQGFGLRGMTERVALMGGALTLSSSPGNGFCIAATLPASGHD